MLYKLKRQISARGLAGSASISDESLADLLKNLNDKIDKGEIEFSRKDKSKLPGGLESGSITSAFLLYIVPGAVALAMVGLYVFLQIENL